MAIVLFCESAPFLKLGPGPRLPESEIVTFVNGYATIDDADPNRDEKLRWATSTGDPRIEVLDEGDAGRVVAAQDAHAFICDEHEEPKAFASKRALNGHRLAVHSPFANTERKPLEAAPV